MVETERPGASTPGQLLRSARQLRGWSIGEVAAELNLLPDIIQALENDDYDDLAGRTYVVGYLRSYGKLASVNVDGAIKGHTTLMPPLQDGPGTMTENLVRGQPVAIHYRWVVTTLVLFLVVGGLYAAYLKRSDDVEKISLSVAKKTEPVPELVREPVPQEKLPSIETGQVQEANKDISASGDVTEVSQDKSSSDWNVREQKTMVTAIVAKNVASDSNSSELAAASVARASGQVANQSLKAVTDSTDLKTPQPAVETVTMIRPQTEPQTKIQPSPRQSLKSRAREIAADHFIKTEFVAVISGSVRAEAVQTVSVPSQSPVDQVKVPNVANAQVTDTKNRQKVVLGPTRELTVLISESTQVIIWDGDGVQLFRKYLKGGKVVTVSGIPPFDVQLQSAEGVKIVYAGQQFDVPVPKTGRNARFMVGVED